MNITELEKAISEKDQHVMGALITVWNLFMKLPEDHPDDTEDFRKAIHECQRIMAYRFARRAAPGVFGKIPGVITNNNIAGMLMPEDRKQPPFAEGYNPWRSIYSVTKGASFECACWFYGTNQIVENCYFDGYLFHDKNRLEVIHPLMFTTKKQEQYLPKKEEVEMTAVMEEDIAISSEAEWDEDTLKAEGWKIVKDIMPPANHLHEEVTIDVKIMMNDGTIYEKAYYDFEEEEWWGIIKGSIGDEERLTEAPIFWKYLENKKLKKK